MGIDDKLDVVGVCADTSDADANCETGTVGLSTVVSGTNSACLCLLVYGERQRRGSIATSCAFMSNAI